MSEKNLFKGAARGNVLAKISFGEHGYFKI